MRGSSRWSRSTFHLRQRRGSVSFHSRPGSTISVTFGAWYHLFGARSCASWIPRCMRICAVTTGALINLFGFALRSALSIAPTLLLARSASDGVAAARRGTVASSNGSRRRALPRSPGLAWLGGVVNPPADRCWCRAWFSMFDRPAHPIWRPGTSSHWIRSTALRHIARSAIECSCASHSKGRYARTRVRPSAAAWRFLCGCGKAWFILQEYRQQVARRPLIALTGSVPEEAPFLVHRIRPVLHHAARRRRGRNARASSNSTRRFPCSGTTRPPARGSARYERLGRPADGAQHVVLASPCRS